ncbi:hypothetical protein [Mesorhizobium silamurunense]|uniref:hypothetical protein n=1 Tax=Mesorhizobium silamurunense TaxID=499528 RepID=UPI001FE3CE29|nr:hypothetical protein [Mesorhizobium silamurunense]
MIVLRRRLRANLGEREVGLGEREPVGSDGNGENGKENAACNQHGTTADRPPAGRVFRIDQPDAGVADAYDNRQPAASALSLTDDFACGERDIAADGFDFKLAALAP